jgi:hypothetical protein
MSSLPFAGSATLSPAQLALQRLAASRAHLQLAWVQAAPASGAGPSGPTASSPLASLAAQGILNMLAERWRQSPWRLSLQLGNQAADALLRPLAQQHPVGLVLAAAATGGLVALVRPWRWLPATRLLALWPLAARVVAQAALRSNGDGRPGA